MGAGAVILAGYGHIFALRRPREGSKSDVVVKLLSLSGPIGQTSRSPLKKVPLEPLPLTVISLFASVGALRARRASGCMLARAELTLSIHAAAAPTGSTPASMIKMRLASRSCDGSVPTTPTMLLQWASRRSLYAVVSSASNQSFTLVLPLRPSNCSPLLTMNCLKCAMILLGSSFQLDSVIV